MCWTVLDSWFLSASRTVHCDYLRPRVHGFARNWLGYWECLNEKSGKECGEVGQNQGFAGFLGQDPSALAGAPSERASSVELERKRVQD